MSDIERARRRRRQAKWDFRLYVLACIAASCFYLAGLKRLGEAFIRFIAL